MFACLACLMNLDVAYAGDSDQCASPPKSPFVANVRDKGAKGNGIADDTAAMQAAIDVAKGKGGTVLVPDGTYMVDAVIGIKIQSDVSFRMSEGAVLKAIPNGKANYNIIKIANVSNINIIGGTLIGEREQHSGSTGEWGMGITLMGATNVVIEGVTVKNTWGDGFYISGASKNVKFCSVVADNNRRQGMSIISVDGMIVKNSVFKNTGGAAPQAGLDFEPNERNAVSNVQIMHSQFIDNKGFGVQFYQGAKQSSIENVTIAGNTIASNRAGGIIIHGTFGHKIIDNVIRDNKNYGVYLSGGAKGNTVSGNKLNGKNDIRDEGENTVIRNQIN